MEALTPWSAAAWRRFGLSRNGAGFFEKYSTMTDQTGQSDQSAARPAHSKELTLSLNQRFFE